MADLPRNLECVNVDALGVVHEDTLKEALRVYQAAFIAPPYSELFSDDEAKEALQYVLDEDGHLLFGSIGEHVVSLAGGYYKDAEVYYIEELAVDPARQGNGFGRQTLRSLIDTALETDPDLLQIRTSAANARAISLYESEGFALGPFTEVAASTRDNGRIELDERVHLMRKVKEEAMKDTTLNRVAIAYPSGNTTAVVFDQMLGEDRDELNKAVMGAWAEIGPDQPEIEQCCFVTLPVDPDCIGRVEMFGGEFCGNATRSVIYLLTGGKDYQGKIEVSGVDRPLDFTVEKGVVSVEMPVPESGEAAKQVDEGTLVQLDGIAHLVVNDPDTQKEQTARERLTKLVEENKYDLAEQPAVGVTYYDEKTGNADFAVWVQEVNTIFDETACGSGTCSIGIALAVQKGADVELKVVQPSGESIQTSAVVKDNKVKSSVISGNVGILYDGKYAIA